MNAEHEILRATLLQTPAEHLVDLILRQEVKIHELEAASELERAELDHETHLKNCAKVACERAEAALERLVDMSTQDRADVVMLARSVKERGHPDSGLSVKLAPFLHEIAHTCPQKLGTWLSECKERNMKAEQETRVGAGFPPLSGFLTSSELSKMRTACTTFLVVGAETELPVLRSHLAAEHRAREELEAEIDGLKATLAEERNDFNVICRIMQSVQTERERESAREA